MFEILSGLLMETWYLLGEMAPYLLFGFLIAGILNLYISRDRVTRHLSERRFSSVLKASLFGIPLPLCSCGVIPVAAHLEKQGASRGATLSFLISTPTTGVDSILATYSLLGPLLALARPVAALFNGLLTGLITNLTDQTQPSSAPITPVTEVSAVPEQPPPTLAGKAVAALRYGFIDLVEDVSKWLVIGILAGGAISYLVPDSFIESYLGNPWLAYMLMLLIGIPMYVCATGSIPIAASLILKGMSPGAGFVFLFAGPATNTATLSFVGGKLGRRNLLVYLTSILAASVVFGLLIDWIWLLSGQSMALVGGHMEMLPAWLKTGSAILLLGLMVRPYLWRESQVVTGKGLVFTVPDMSCEHCRKKIQGALSEISGVDNITINLQNQQVEVLGSASRESVQFAIEKAGYSSH